MLGEFFVVYFDHSVGEVHSKSWLKTFNIFLIVFLKVDPSQSFIYSNEQNIQFKFFKFLPPPGFEPGSLGAVSR